VAWLTRDKHDDEVIPPVQDARATVLFSSLALVTALIIGIAVGPAQVMGKAPDIKRFAWLVPTVLMLGWLLYFLRPFLNVKQLPRQLAFVLTAGVAVTWTGYILDHMLVELSPHWAQKHVIAAYYEKRKGPEEPLIAWQLYWRGENFYTRNEIWDPAKPLKDKSVFLGDRNAENMQKYFADHKGQKVFFVVERARFETLRGLLPAEDKPSLTIEDETNNKLYLASARLR
jgi:hypothetical protein